MSEFASFQQTLYDLEKNHQRIKAQYENRSEKENGKRGERGDEKEEKVAEGMKREKVKKGGGRC